MKKNNILNYLKNIIIPCLFFSLITGCFTGAVVVCYKWICEHVFELSHIIYDFLREKPYFLPIAIAITFGIAILNKILYKIELDAKGGGIPNAVAYVRGIISFRWLRTIIFVFISSMITFLTGVPLDNDGPCVLSGAIIGRGVVKTLGGKNQAWDKYIMTGGACAGFASATNSPVTGLMFSIEEAQHKLSPMIIMVAGASVIFSICTTRVLAPLMGVTPELFPHLAPNVLKMSELWIPLVIGILSGFLSVGFIALFDIINKVINVKLKKINETFIIFAIFALTLVFGTISPFFTGTGHGLVDKVIENPNAPVYILILAILIRSLLTNSGASTGLTGGIFIPSLSIGALFASLLFKLFKVTGVVDDSYFQIIILLGMSACFASMIKTPVTAVIFSVEALSMGQNILAVVITVVVSYFITELFSAKSITDKIMETREEEQNEGLKLNMIDAMVIVKENSFVVGKSLRDIIWPHNMFVLTIKHSEDSPLVDEHGETSLLPGDVLHVRYTTHEPEKTHREIEDLVGVQKYNENEWIE